MNIRNPFLLILIIFTSLILNSCNESVKGKWSQSDRLSFRKEMESIQELSALGDNKSNWIECYLNKCEANYSSFYEADRDENGCTRISEECLEKIFSKSKNKNLHNSYSFWEEFNNPLYEYGFKAEISNTKKWLSWDPSKKTLSRISDETNDKILKDKLHSDKLKDAIKETNDDPIVNSKWYHIKPLGLSKEEYIKTRKERGTSMVGILKEKIPSPITLQEYLNLSVSYMDKYKNSLTYRIDNSGYINKGIIEYINFTSLKYKVVIIEGDGEFIIIQFVEPAFIKKSEKPEFDSFINSIKPLYDIKKVFNDKEQIISSDGYSLGNEDEFINGCEKVFGKIETNGHNLDVNSFCSCLKGITERIKKDDFIRLIKNSDFSVLFNDSVYDYFLECSNDAFDLSNSNGKFPTEGNLNTTEILTKQCMYELSKIEIVSEKNKIAFCNCKVEKAYKSDLSWNQFSELLFEDREAYNKIIFPCSGLLKEVVNYYNADDIFGDMVKTEVPLISNGSIFKLELEIKGLKRYFTFDTGADELIINSQLENDLIEKNMINFNDYIGEQEFVLADGSIVNARRILIDNVKIGNYRIDNVIAYVNDEGGMLCGMGFLSKFKKWKLDNNSNKLILFK